MNESVANAFLENVDSIKGEHIFEDLCRDFTIEELYDAIFSFINGKSPGPDGLTIEFYKCVFSTRFSDAHRFSLLLCLVKKYDLLTVGNCLFGPFKSQTDVFSQSIHVNGIVFNVNLLKIHKSEKSYLGTYL